jgi:hypothetical protein
MSDSETRVMQLCHLEQRLYDAEEILNEGTGGYTAGPRPWASEEERVKLASARQLLSDIWKYVEAIFRDLGIDRPPWTSGPEPKFAWKCHWCGELNDPAPIHRGGAEVDEDKGDDVQSVVAAIHNIVAMCVGVSGKIERVMQAAEAATPSGRALADLAVGMHFVSHGLTEACGELVKAVNDEAEPSQEENAS